MDSSSFLGTPVYFSVLQDYYFRLVFLKFFDTFGKILNHCY
jgi:hypothetical protein